MTHMINYGGGKAIKIPSWRIQRLIKKVNEYEEKAEHHLNQMIEIKSAIATLDPKSAKKSIDYLNNEYKEHKDLYHYYDARKIKLTNKVNKKLRKKDYPSLDNVKIIPNDNYTGSFVSPETIDNVMDSHGYGQNGMTSTDAYNSILSMVNNGKNNKNPDINPNINPDIDIDIPLPEDTDSKLFREKIANINNPDSKEHTDTKAKESVKVPIIRHYNPSTKVSKNFNNQSSLKGKNYSNTDTDINELIEQARQSQAKVKKLKGSLTEENQEIQQLKSQYDKQQQVVSEKIRKLQELQEKSQQTINEYTEKYNRAQKTKEDITSQMKEAQSKELALDEMLAEMDNGEDIFQKTMM